MSWKAKWRLNEFVGLSRRLTAKIGARARKGAMKINYASASFIKINPNISSSRFLGQILRESSPSLTVELVC